MKHINHFNTYLVLEAGKPYLPDNFKLFTQILGNFLQEEFVNSDQDKDLFISKLPFFDVDYDIKVDIRKRSPLSLSDVEEQEKDNFSSYLMRSGKSKLINTNFEQALGYYGSFVWQLPRKSGNQAVSKLKKSFPDLDKVMDELIKRGTKPVSNVNEIPELLQSIQTPRELKKRGRKAGTKNKPKISEEVASLKIPLGMIEQFKREGKSKVDQLEEEADKLHDQSMLLTKQLNDSIDSLNRQIKAKLKEIELRKKVLGIKD